MPVGTTKINVGVWDVLNVGTRYRYRVCTVGKGRDWTIYKMKREKVLADPEHTTKDGPTWEEVQDGFKSKASAVEFVEELATKEDFNPVANHLNNTWDDSACDPVKDIKNCIKKMESDKVVQVNPVADLLNNIDDGVDLNAEGY